MKKGSNFIAYSLAVDEKNDSAQLSIRGVDSDLCITKELLGIRAMHSTTTGKCTLEEVSNCVIIIKLPWNKLVGLMKDGAPAMCAEKSGLDGRMQEKMQQENCVGELTVYHCIIHQEALCGKVLKSTQGRVSCDYQHACCRKSF